MYYIENIDNPSFLEKTFNIIKFENNKLHIPITEEINENKNDK